MLYTFFLLFNISGFSLLLFYRLFSFKFSPNKEETVNNLINYITLNILAINCTI